MGQIEDLEQKLESSDAKLLLLSGSVVSVGKDIKNLKARIEALEQGSISQEQLNELTSAAGSISDKIDSLGADLTALDAETPDEEVPSPEVPPVEVPSPEVPPVVE